VTNQASTGQDVPATATGRLAARRTILTRILLAGLMVSTFGAGIGVERYGFGEDGNVNASSSFVDSPTFETLQTTWDLIHDTYIDESAINDETLIFGAAKGMVESLGDTGHSTFLAPDEAESFQNSANGELIGIGVELNFENGQPVVISPIDGSPADAAGVKSRDVIVAIDGVETGRLSQTEIFHALRGKEGTVVEVTFERPGDDSTFNVKLTRAKIIIEPVSWTMLPENVALIRLSGFSRGATDALRDALEESKAAGAASMILDLRDNPGGLVLEAIGVASQLLPEGTPIYQLQERGEEPRPVRTTGLGIGTEIPMVVLVNGGSASSAEIVASAVQENDRGTVVGEVTFGTGTVLTPNELEDGSIVMLGTGFWLTAKGNQLWHVGVTPTIEIVLSEDGSAVKPSDVNGLTVEEIAALNDNQLMFAFDELTKP